MILTRSTFPACSEEGFLPMRSVRSIAKGLTLDEFRTEHPSAVLHVVDIKVGAASGNPDATVQPGIQLRALMNPARSAFRYLDEVAPLVRRAEATADAGSISLGRAPENDIVLSVESVSHVHAVFSSDGQRWLLTDRDSKNGTTLNGTPLAKGQPTPLHSGDRILFGGEIAAVFLTSEALYEKAHR